jgi:cellulose synthase operon protein C
MSAQALLEEVDKLSHSKRVRRMVMLGHDVRVGNPSAGATLAELGRSPDAYCRSLALAAAYGTRDVGYPLSRLDDPSRTVRARADKLLALLGSDAQIAAALVRVPAHRAKRVVFLLRRRRRQSAIDAFLAALGQRPEPSLFDLLPLGSTELVRRHAPHLFERLGREGFVRLAKHAPAIMTELLEEAIATSSGIDPRLNYRLGVATHVLAQRGAEHALGLFERLSVGESSAGFDIARTMARKLVRRFPTQVFDALRTRHQSAAAVHPPGVFGAIGCDKVAHRLGPERLAYLIEHAPQVLSDGLRARRWFWRLSQGDRNVVVDVWLEKGRGPWGAFLLRQVPATGPRAAARERAFLRWSHASQTAQGVVAIGNLQALPRDLAAREARRHLHAVPWLTTRHHDRLAYAIYLPFAEAKAELAAFLGHPEGEWRARAGGALMQTVERDSAAMADALDYAAMRKFEQDPVRQALLEAFASLPVRVFSAAHLEPLERILGDAFAAADRSAGTSAAAERLIVRLFRVAPEFAANWLTRLLEINGRVSTTGLGLGLTPKDVRALEPVLSELARSWADRERCGALIWLAQSLGRRRLRYTPSLIAALERLAREMPFIGVAASALSLLRAGAPRHFAELVPELVFEDPSFVLLPDVAQFIARRRQELAVLLVAERPIVGRFASGKSRWVIDFGLALSGFVPYVQRAYQAQLVAYATAEKTGLDEQRFATSRLARLPFVSPAPLLALCRDERQTMRELAVRSLAWLDGPEALPALLECLGDERARWGIYALRSQFRELSRSAVLAHLRAVPTNKVTVMKEVVRLLGDLGGDDAFSELIALDRPDAHRDVRIAVLRALWNHIDQEATWTSFERAASDPDWVIAARLSEVPLGRLSDAAEVRLCGLFARVLQRPETEARLDLLNRAAYLPLRDANRSLFRVLVSHLVAQPDEAAAAARAVVMRMLPSELEVVTSRFRDCFRERETLVAVLAQLRPNPYSPNHLRKLAEAVLEGLASERLAVVQRVALAAYVHGFAELAVLFRELSRNGQLNYDTMTVAIDAIRRCVHPELLETRLTRESDPKLRRLALAALECAASSGHGWSAERIERLDQYRADPSHEVAAPAAFVFPPLRKAI